MNYWQNDLIRLRAVEPEDAALFFHWNHNSERARNLDFVWPPLSLEATRRWTIETSAHRIIDGLYHWVIENTQGIPVGSISTHNCEPRNGVFSLAFDIAPEHRRNGYASAAVRMVLRYYFDELRYQKVLCVVYGFNVASQRFHQNFGFALEGRLTRMIYHAGQHHDKIIYGLTDDAFRALGAEVGQVS